MMWYRSLIKIEKIDLNQKKSDLNQKINFFDFY